MARIPSGRTYPAQALAGVRADLAGWVVAVDAKVDAKVVAAVVGQIEDEVDGILVAHPALDVDAVYRALTDEMRRGMYRRLINDGLRQDVAAARALVGKAQRAFEDIYRQVFGSSPRFQTFWQRTPLCGAMAALDVAIAHDDLLGDPILSGAQKRAARRPSLATVRAALRACGLSPGDVTALLKVARLVKYPGE